MRLAQMDVRSWRVPAVVAVLVFGLSGGGPVAVAAQTEETVESPADDSAETPENPFPDGVELPSGVLDGGTGWLNSSGPISMKDLRGKVVIFDFWTYCCINCIHVLPDLAYLEEKWDKELVVIGVHSAKFDNEKETENIRRAIQRYEIKHPVVNDSNMRIWRRFGVRSWPTLGVVDPRGKYIGSISGEGHRELLDTVVGKLVEYHSAKGTLDRTPVRFDLESDKLKPTPLRFPGKVSADERVDRLFISDSNHNRIVIASRKGELLDVIGSGAIGAADGSFDEAEFDHPQGMALVGDQLYVADTENHLIRVVDLKQEKVTTLAGTGKQDRERTGGGRLRETALNSPWDLIHVKGELYIAMAGPHQLWSHKLGTDQIGVYAGSGREDITDGPLRSATMAQPSGLASDGEALYVCDSEGSAIRRVPVDPESEMATIAGPHDLPRGASLFEFGDEEGIGSKARLQHPLGIAFDGNRLYVDDSYNHKVKRLTKTDQGWKVEDWLGSGEPGNGLEPVEFSEPAGLSVAGGRLFIADTNNHRVLVADLETAEVSLLEIEGLEPPQVEEEESADDTAETIELPEQRVRSGKALTIRAELDLPEGYKVNDLRPAQYRMTAPGDQTLIAADALNVPRTAELSKSGDAVTLQVPLVAETGAVTLRVSLTYTFCRDGVGGLCKLRTVDWSLPVRVSRVAKGSSIEVKVPASMD